MLDSTSSTGVDDEMVGAHCALWLKTYTAIFKDWLGTEVNS